MSTTQLKVDITYAYCLTACAQVSILYSYKKNIYVLPTLLQKLQLI